MHTATTEFYPLSLHDALPILPRGGGEVLVAPPAAPPLRHEDALAVDGEVGDHLARGLVAHHGADRQLDDHVLTVLARSEEHTSELQSHSDLVCRLLLEKKK